jgi:hypothetical protein
VTTRLTHSALPSLETGRRLRISGNDRFLEFERQQSRRLSDRIGSDPDTRQSRSTSSAKYRSVLVIRRELYSLQELLDFSLEVGDVITIRRGLLGALWMTNGNRRAETRVQRIK